MIVHGQESTATRENSVGTITEAKGPFAPKQRAPRGSEEAQGTRNMWEDKFKESERTKKEGHVENKNTTREGNSETFSETLSTGGRETTQGTREVWPGDNSNKEVKARNGNRSNDEMATARVPNVTSLKGNIFEAIEQGKKGIHFRTETKHNDKNVKEIEAIIRHAGAQVEWGHTQQRKEDSTGTGGIAVIFKKGYAIRRMTPKNKTQRDWQREGRLEGFAIHTKEGTEKTMSVYVVYGDVNSIPRARGLMNAAREWAEEVGGRAIITGDFN